MTGTRDLGDVAAAASNRRQTLGATACSRNRRPSGQGSLSTRIHASKYAGGRALDAPVIALAPTLRQTWRRDLPDAAICVQKVDVQCVLQFTLLLALSCVLHRLASRVIHRRESFNNDLATIDYQRQVSLAPSSRGRSSSTKTTTTSRAPGQHFRSVHVRPPPLLPGRRRPSTPVGPPAKRGRRDAVALDKPTRLVLRSLATAPIMILPQVHLRKPCYDFYFL